MEYKLNIKNIKKLQGMIDLLLENESRNNEAKPIRYWYPLSLATFGSDEIIEALDSMCSFRTSMAEKTLSFEKAFANWQGSCDAVMVNSGSSADLLISLLLTNPLKPLLALDSEILIPVVTWPTQIWSAMMGGLKVKLVDVDPNTLNIDYEDLERQITHKTKAIFLVHLMGNPCNMDQVLDIAKKYNLLVIEDCCEAMGASWGGIKVGNFGVGGTFSLFFSHHITAMEGGMIVVNKTEHVDQLKLLRAHGWVRNVNPEQFNLSEYPDIDSRYAFVNWGLNVRPTEVQAAFGLRQLEKADRFDGRRKEIAERFFRYLEKKSWLKTPRVEPKANPSWLALPIMVESGAPFSRNDLTSYLEKAGVETRPMVTGNIAHHPVAKLFPEFSERKFPGADEVHARGFYIGLSPMQTDEAVTRLIDVFNSFLENYTNS
jgi:CDP-6-deoxy-D-xylo-4-hexulose-3-dehydrase